MLRKTTFSRGKALSREPKPEIENKTGLGFAKTGKDGQGHRSMPAAPAHRLKPAFPSSPLQPR